VRFKEQKKYFAVLKHSNLARFFPWRKQGLMDMFKIVNRLVAS
jgi:hypothetical protein